MLRRLQYRLRYGPYLHSEIGTRNFAELAIGLLARKVTKRSAFYREMNENLLVEKANLRMRSDELLEQSMLDADIFFSIRLRLWINYFMTAIVALAGVFLLFISIDTFIQADASLSENLLSRFVAAVVSVVVFGSGVIITERLASSLIPIHTNRNIDGGTSISLLWAILLVVVELVVFGIADIRASQLSTAQDSRFLYVTFVALIILLPLIAGALRWDAARFMDAYKTTRVHHEIDGRLAQIDSILRQNAEYESNHYKVWSTEYWDLLSEFKTIKDYYNQKLNIEESLVGHFSATYDAFQSEAQKRYELDIRDLTAKSIRRLEKGMQQIAGDKIGGMAPEPQKLHDAVILDVPEVGEPDDIDAHTIALYPQSDIPSEQKNDL